MTQTELNFLTANKINFESVALGFTRNIHHNVLSEYERIYRENIDPQFVLIYYCGACVFDMIKRLSNHYETIIGQSQTNIQNVYTPEMISQMTESNDKSVQVEKKPSRSKKSK
jgi:hypothetical protein